MRPRKVWRETAGGTTVTLRRWPGGQWSVVLDNPATAATHRDFEAGLLWRDERGLIFFDAGLIDGQPAPVYPMGTEVLRAIADLAELVDVPLRSDL